LAFSCRERAADHPQKANDLVREAVCCNAVFGRPVHLFIRSHITERDDEYAIK
jgi:hypothetical protein